MAATLIDWIVAIGTIAGPAVSAFAVKSAVEAQKQTQEAQRDLLRPIIRLDEEKARILFTDDRYVNWHVVRPRQTHTLTLTNAGAGLATHIEGVIFGPLQSDFVASDRRLTLRAPKALSPGESCEVEAIIGQTVVFGTTKIGPYTLNADVEKPAHERVHLDLPLIVARLTLTYRDVYGRKHASIYECTDRGEWRPLDFVKAIRYDLDELNRNDRLKRIPGPANLPAPAEITSSRGAQADQSGLV